jgi:gliding motility-associated-like protein
VILPNDTLYCGPFQTAFTSNIKNKQKLWNTGDTGMSINVTKAGIYWLKVSDDPCVAVDSVVIKNDLSKVNVGPDTVICADAFAPFYHQGPLRYKTYNWGNGQVSDTVYVSKPRKYILEVSNNNNCFSKDTIDFIAYQPPILDLRDTLFCRNTNVLLNALNTDISTQAESKYLWSNGSTSNLLVVSNNQKVWLKLTDTNQCSFTDTINPTFTNCDTNSIIIPNVFTPSNVNAQSNDNINDLFETKFTGFDELKGKIYNRWGNLVYSFKYPTDSYWNGGLNNDTSKPCPSGTYYYLFEFTNSKTNLVRSYNGVVELIR